MHIEDLGNLTGKLLVFGGVYSNLQALMALVYQAQQAGVPAQNVICTGDVVAYCADPESCAAFVRAQGGPVLAGNCEKQLAQGASDCGCGFADGSTCSVLSRAWYAHADQDITDTTRKWMAALPDRIVFRHAGKRYAVIHGGASEISRFVWPVTPDAEIESEIEILRGQVGHFDVVLAGHSGIPMQRHIGDVTWVNSGAIGLPAHDGMATTSYCQIEENQIEIKSLRYDANAAAQAMARVGLTQGYHETLVSGYWPSEETLPSEMRLDRTG